VKKNWISTLLALLCTCHLLAHEVRPARLVLNQETDTTYHVFWKLPAIKEGVLRLKPVMEFDHQIISRDPGKDLGDAYIESWTFQPSQDITGSQISIDGLSKTITDVFFTVNDMSGGSASFIVRPDQPYFTIDGQRSIFQVIKDFVILGVEHIWLGYDHLLFVLCLLWLIAGWKKLIQTITAFTLAHSITLIASTLGWMSLPSSPVEAVIALSIVFLAIEIIRHQRGEEVFTSKYPWVVALSFGLLHGFGFAGALSEIGLPQNAIATSLLGFNLGVELGQIIFVIVVLTVVSLIKRMIKEIPSWASTATVYLIGGIASFWLIERVAGFF